MIVIVFILIRKLSCLQRSVLDRIEKRNNPPGKGSVLLSARFIKASATEFLFPPVEEEGEEYGQTPIGDGVRDVRFHAPVVEGGEDIRFGEHVHDFDCEDEGEEFDGFQIICEKAGSATTNAWGRTILVKARKEVMPMATAASYWPWSTERRAPRIFSDW